MPRTARASVGGICYHVLNRANARGDVFHKDGDFATFVELISQANERLPMRVLAYCLLNNHFHLVLWPRHDGDLSRWMQWLLTSHVRRYHRHYDSSGHVWQGLQGLSRSERWPPVGAVAVCGAQRVAGQFGFARGGMALVEFGLAAVGHASGNAGGLAD